MSDTGLDQIDGAALDAIIGARGWVFDVDGCLVRTRTAGGEGGKLLPGAADLLDLLRQQDRQFVLCTNASARKAEDYADHLRALGLPLERDDLVTAATAAADHIVAHHPGARVLPVGAEGLEHALRDRGIEIVGPGDRPADAVVVGGAPHYETQTLTAAARAIDDNDAAFYVTVMTRWFHGGHERSVASSSAIAAGLQYVTGRQPVVCGKPSTVLAETLAARLGGTTAGLVVVGDAADAEMPLAHAMGATSVLVLSGATSAHDVPALTGQQRPDLVLPDVHALFTALTGAGRDQRPNEGSTK